MDSSKSNTEDRAQQVGEDGTFSSKPAHQALGQHRHSLPVHHFQMPGSGRLSFSSSKPNVITIRRVRTPLESFLPITFF